MKANMVLPITIETRSCSSWMGGYDSHGEEIKVITWSATAYFQSMKIAYTPFGSSYRKESQAINYVKQAIRDLNNNA